MKVGRFTVYLLACFLIGIVFSLGFSQFYSSIIAPSFAPQLSLDEMYENAIKDAMIAKEGEVYSGLTAIVESNDNLIWQGEPGNRSVLVVTWTRFASSYPVGETVITSWGDSWVTVAPDIRVFFKDEVNSGTNLTVRTAQLLGLPPNSSNTYFVELWVNPQSLFRPSPDSEITDTVATLAFPSSVSAEYKVWFNNNIIYSYYPIKLPWTRLGYSYDWGNTASHVGLSEFVIRQNSTVSVKSVTPTNEYLSSND